MYTIRKSSGSGSTVWNQVIYFEPTEPKAHASLLMLNQELLLQDEDFLESYAVTAKRIEFSRNLLTMWQDWNGSLSCVYCCKPNLIIELAGMNVDRNIKATLDHIVPISEGGGMFDVDNVTCSCQRCNENKRSQSLEEYLHKIKLSKDEFTSRRQKYLAHCSAHVIKSGICRKEIQGI